MLTRFADKKLERLEKDPEYTADFADDVVKAFRKRMQFIRDARDQRDFRAMRSLRFEKLKGGRRHQWSMRLNDQWRLILEFKQVKHRKVVVIVKIEDYH